MGDKSRFGPEQINTEALSILPEFLIKPQLFYSGLREIKWQNQLDAERLVGYLLLHILCAFVE